MTPDTPRDSHPPDLEFGSKAGEDQETVDEVLEETEGDVNAATEALDQKRDKPPRPAGKAEPA